jgi:hypothetical protein
MYLQEIPQVVISFLGFLSLNALMLGALYVTVREYWEE